MRKVYLEFSGIASVKIDVPIKGRLIVRADEGIDIDKIVKEFLLKQKRTSSADFEFDDIRFEPLKLRPETCEDLIDEKLWEHEFEVNHLDALTVEDSR